MMNKNRMVVKAEQRELGDYPESTGRKLFYGGKIFTAVTTIIELIK